LARDRSIVEQDHWAQTLKIFGFDLVNAAVAPAAGQDLPPSRRKRITLARRAPWTLRRWWRAIEPVF
jgi:hypothetical protein